MSNEQALLNCTFGWGKTCRLYLDSIEIAGKSYNLNDLTAIHPSYRNVFGVPSARLELSFGMQRLTLRGIPDPNVARLMVSHLQTHCSESNTVHTHSRFSQARNLARAQARAWQRSNKMPAIPDSTKEFSFSRGTSDSLKYASTSQSAFEPVFDEAAQDSGAAPQGRPSATDTSLTPGETLEAFAQLANDLTTISPDSRSLPTPRYQPPLHSVHLVTPGRKTLDTCSMPVPALKSSVLPIIHVPVRLQPGECAHYSIGASLCSDRTSGSERAPYPPLDHGLLILTNRRLFYIGKRSQLILAYTHLWYVSLLHTAIALHIEGQFRRIIIELEHPHEWASRIEQLSFIARRSRPRSELPTLAVAAIPGLKANAMTLKRPAIKVPAKDQAAPGNSQTPLLAERVESKIVDAQTISLSEPVDQQYADVQTQHFPSPADPEGLVSSEATEQLAPADLTTRDISQQQTLENAVTLEFPQQQTIENAITLEFPQLAPESMSSQDLSQTPALVDATTQDLFHSPEVLEMTTQELFQEPVSGERATSGLLLETEEVEEPRQSRGLDEERESRSGTLYDPRLQLSSPEWDGRNYEDIDTLPLYEQDSQEDGNTQTINLRNRRVSQARTISLKPPVSNRLPDLEITPRCISRTRAPRRPLYTKGDHPG